MSLACKCSSPLWALGVPDCYPVLAPVRRMAFTATLDGSGDPLDFDLLASALYSDAKRLFTPLLYNVTSERPDPVREELSGVSFFVRSSARTITATLAKPPAELLRNIEAMRCRARLGVFLIDQNGIVWGMRAGPFSAAPIPIEPQTLDIKLDFPSDSAITKATLSFTLALSFDDFELVPLSVSNSYLTYVAPLPVELQVFNPTGSAVDVLVFVQFARGASAGPDMYIPLDSLAVSNFLVQDSSGSPYTVSSVTSIAPGRYMLSFTPSLPTGTYTLKLILTSTSFDTSNAIVQFVV